MNKVKEKINEIKNNKYLFWTIVGTLIFLIVGIVGVIVGFYLVGEDPLKWFVSPMAITIYFLIAFVLLPLGIGIGISIWSSKNERK